MSDETPGVEKTAQGLAFSGVIDHQTIPVLIKKMPMLNNAGKKSAVLDLSATSKIDSAGLAFLIDWGNKNQRSGDKIKLRGTSGQLRQLIDIMGLRQFFEFHP